MSASDIVDIFIDLETFGRGAHAVFIEIGACKIDFETGEVHDTFFRPINWESVTGFDCDYLRYLLSQPFEQRNQMFDNMSEDEILLFVFGDDRCNFRTIDPSTIKWWLLQSDEACAALLKNSKNGLSLNEVLEQFKDWCGSDCIVWGNGSTFDITMLEDAYGRDNSPWVFYNVNDCRTIERFSNVQRSDVPFCGTKHSSLDDAVYEATYIYYMLQDMK